MILWLTNANTWFTIKIEIRYIVSGVQEGGDCMTNGNMLRGRIVQEYGSVKKFCTENGFSHSLIYMKLNGKSDFTYKQIEEIAEILKIPHKEIGAYFF